MRNASHQEGSATDGRVRGGVMGLIDPLRGGDVGLMDPPRGDVLGLSIPR
jgi:hypothetical protein